MSMHFFQEAQNQPVLIETLLFLSAASHTASLKRGDASPYLIESSIQDTLRLRSHALKSLQAFLLNSSRAISEQTVLVIAHLACVESAQANPEAVKAHALGLQQLTNASGGLENVEIRILSLVYCVDTMKGLVLDTPPIFGISKKWGKWIKNNSFCIAPNASSPSQSALGKWLFNSSWSPGLPDELVSIIKGFQILTPLL